MYTLAWLLFAATAVLSLILLARYIKRTRSETACPNCDYPEAPDKSPYDIHRRCSECGLTWGEAEKRNDWKRRACWLVVVLSFFISLWSGITAYRSDTIRCIIPTWVLSATVGGSGSIDPDADVNGRAGMFARELGQRQAKHQQKIQMHQSALLAQSIVDSLAEKGTLVRSRPKWPRNVPVRVAPAYPESFRSLGDVRLRLSGGDGQLLDEREIRARHGNRIYADPTVVVPDRLISNGTISLIFEIVGGPQGDSILARRNVSISIEFVDSWSEILRPINTTIEWLFDPTTVVNDMPEYRQLVTIISGDRTKTQNPQFGIGCKIQVVEDDNILTEVEYIFAPRSQEQSGVLEIVKLTYRTDDIWGNRYVRIVPDEEIALRDFDNDIFWFGEAIQFPTRRPRR
jgi:hypothetical protein